LSGHSNSSLIRWELGAKGSEFERMDTRHQCIEGLSPLAMVGRA
jgi:hypothetical protein